jgi:hypothetical protein
MGRDRNRAHGIHGRRSREGLADGLARGTLRATLALALALSCAAVAVAGVGDYRCGDESKVYHGNPRLFQKPCHLSADRVYAEIPEYQEIVRKGLTDKDPRYHFLMKKASERFGEAVKAMARDAAYNHDLVAEDGTIRKEKQDAADIPDRTDATIAKLR